MTRVRRSCAQPSLILATACTAVLLSCAGSGGGRGPAAPPPETRPVVVRGPGLQLLPVEGGEGTLEMRRAQERYLFRRKSR